MEQNETNNLLWRTSAEYRAKVVRELEQKLKMKMSKEAFGQIVY